MSEDNIIYENNWEQLKSDSFSHIISNQYEINNNDNDNILFIIFGFSFFVFFLLILVFYKLKK